MFIFLCCDFSWFPYENCLLGMGRDDCGLIIPLSATVGRNDEFSHWRWQLMT